MKRIVWVLLVCTVVLSGCGSQKKASIAEQSNNVNVEKKDEGEKIDTTKEGINNEDPQVTSEDVKDYLSSTAENDIDTGLRTLKVDVAAGKLTQDQLQVLKFYAKDYMDVFSVETLLRFPNIFEKSLVNLWIDVAKVVKSDNDSYEVIGYLMENSGDFGDMSDPNHLVVLRGTQTDKRYIVGDILNIEGRFMGTESILIDGVTNTMPYIEVHSAFIQSDDGAFFPERASMSEIKNIAKSIFGDNITLRTTNWNDENEAYIDNFDFYVCELDNQSIPKIGTYFFMQRYGTMYVKETDQIYRHVEFSADFKHFFLFSFDRSLGTLTLEYYDQNLNKIWKREMEETENAIYDFTKNNIYLNANNKLYIINIETGEDTFKPSFVGDKIDLRKVEDGIILLGKGKSDAIIKTDLQGNILWTVNTKNNNGYVVTVQEIDGRYVIGTAINGEDGEFNETNYTIIDSIEGDVLQQESVKTSTFYYFN